MKIYIVVILEIPTWGIAYWPVFIETIFGSLPRPLEITEQRKYPHAVKLDFHKNCKINTHLEQVIKGKSLSYAL